MNRRTFLLSFVGIFATATGIWSVKNGYLSNNTRIKNTIFAVFEKRLSYLKWDKTEVLNFIQDFIDHVDNEGYIGGKLNKFSFLYPIYNYTDLLNKTPFFTGKVRSFEEKIITDFLLSSNFFREGADETKPVKYLFYYDPYQAPCQNPLAKW
ncbi:hypothetical protein QUF50_03630 [Thiotrichales bacterium HSG1]|nr:hypothetical protein [Thiotrichales bacterium HSG1]